MANNDPRPAPESPREGEWTRAQESELQVAAADLGLFPGFGETPAGTYETYRRMRTSPTIALARIAATAPIRAAEWSVVSNGDGVPPERVDFVREQFVEPLRQVLLRDAMFALDYGWAPFEKVWESATWRGRPVWRYRKVKPLRVDNTRVVVDRTTGAFLGLRQAGVELPPDKSFVYTSDGEAGSFYGRPRHENVREKAWHPWDSLHERMGQYVRRVAVPVPMVQYPEGKGRDANNNVIDNFDAAKRVLAQLSTGQGVLMPHVLMRQITEAIRGGAKPQELKSWLIEFVEARGQHGRDLVQIARYYDAGQLRGWLVPERAATEGQYGTKAEASAHAQIAMIAAELELQDVVRHVNWYLVDPLLAFNFGDEARGSVQVEAADLVDATRSAIVTVVESLLRNPNTVGAIAGAIDLDASLDQLGIPRAGDAGDGPIRVQGDEGDGPPPEEPAGLSLSLLERAAPVIHERGAGEDQLGPHGFARQWRAADGDLDRLPTGWRLQRAAACRRLASRPMWTDEGEPTDDHLRLVAWGHSPTPERLDRWLRGRSGRQAR